MYHHPLCLYAHIFFIFFFFNDTATTEIYTLSLHDALPISAFLFLRNTKLGKAIRATSQSRDVAMVCGINVGRIHLDRKSTRLNSSHSQISYAVFCLKKKKKKKLNNKTD